MKKKLKISLVIYSNKMDEYLKHDDVIDYEKEAIAELAALLRCKLLPTKLGYDVGREEIKYIQTSNKEFGM